MCWFSNFILIAEGPINTQQNNSIFRQSVFWGCCNTSEHGPTPALYTRAAGRCLLFGLFQGSQESKDGVFPIFCASAGSPIREPLLW